MSQDSDVDRVAAALNGPVIRYRNFGNGPTRMPQRPDPEGPAGDSAAQDATVPAEATPRISLCGERPETQPQVDADSGGVEAPPADTVVAPGHAPVDGAATAPPPASAALPPARPTAESLLVMLRDDARREVRPEPAAAPRDPVPPAAAPSHSLVEQLRRDATLPAPPAEGLLALLTGPALWDLPRPPPAAPILPPLVGQPIHPWTPAAASAAAAQQQQAAPRPVWTAPVLASEPEPDPEPASLAAMFRLVSAPPVAVPPPPARTASLQDVLRGLRSARHG